MVEEAVKTTREVVRVMEEQLADKTRITLDGKEPITLWMIRWAAMTCLRFLVGRDGRTPCERRRGRKCKVPVVCFGEKVWYKQIRESKERKDKFCSEWHEGAWLGHSRSSNETIIGTREGVLRAYAIRRQDADARWDGKAVKEIQGTPQQPNPRKGGLPIPIRVGFDAPMDGVPLRAEEVRKETIGSGRRIKITAAMLEKYGYTEDNCEGCRRKRAGLAEQRPHSEGCRNRIHEEMMKDEEGRKHIEKEKERTDRRLAEGLQKREEEYGDQTEQTEGEERIGGGGSSGSKEKRKIGRASCRERV